MPVPPVYGEAHDACAIAAAFARKSGPHPQRLDPRRSARAVRAAVPRADVRGRAHPPDAFRSEPRCRSRRCSRSRPAAARRTAPIARRARRYDTGVEAEKLMSLDAVLAEARAAKAGGASRFCMGAAWRSPKDRDVENVCAMVEGVKALGLETCATLGMLTPAQARAAEGLGPRLLQPQPRHLAGVLRRDHHHAHLPGSARHARRGARRRHQRLLRRHRRHGRGRGGPRRHDRRAGEPAGASGSRADQHAGAGRGHAARHRRRSSIRWSSCAPSRSRASPCRSRWCGSPPGART